MPDWGLGTAFASVLSPMWRIVLASITAEVVSELVDTEVYHSDYRARMLKRKHFAVVPAGAMRFTRRVFPFCDGSRERSDPRRELRNGRSAKRCAGIHGHGSWRVWG